nr:MAG TPA: Protective antigen [Caudoviricetes sp.]
MLDSQYSRLPPQLQAAADYRQRLIAQIVRRVLAAWRPNSPQDPNSWFASHALPFTEMVTHGQLLAAQAAIASADVALDLQHYDAVPELSADPEAFAGVTGSGDPVMGLAYAQAQKITELVDAEAPITERAQAWHHAGVMLATATQTAISDAARMAILTHLAARPGTTWVRVVRPPCCARCAILAGKKGTSRMKFLRHPGCDCTAIPVSEATSDMHKLFHFDAKEYFDSLAPEQQAKVFTKAGARAIRDGADINQVVNARRGMTTITSAGGRRRLITTEGTTKRGWASEYLREQYGASLQKAGGRYRRTSVARLMPEEIYRIAGDDRDLALALLHKNGFLTDATPDLSGKWSWAKRDPAVLEAKRRIGARPSIAISGPSSADDQAKPAIGAETDARLKHDYSQRITTSPRQFRKVVNRVLSYMDEAHQGKTFLPDEYKIGLMNGRDRLGTKVEDSAIRGTSYRTIDHEGITRYRVTINGTFQGQELTTLHELGHLIKWKYETLPEMKPVLAAIRRAPSTREIATYAGNLTESHTQIYLLLDDELFARAYAQWVTTKTGAPRLVNTLNFHRGREHVLDSVQWQDSEFAQYIMPALDEFFTQV